MRWWRCALFWPTEPLVLFMYLRSLKKHKLLRGQTKSNKHFYQIWLMILYSMHKEWHNEFVIQQHYFLAHRTQMVMVMWNIVITWGPSCLLIFIYIIARPLFSSPKPKSHLKYCHHNNNFTKLRALKFFTGKKIIKKIMKT
jgi:hypothetical protein